jgi:hypothetical protein
LTSKPELRVLVKIPYQPAIQELQNTTGYFQAMYGSLWQEEVIFRLRHNRHGLPFFSLRTVSSDENTGILRADLTGGPGTDGFTISIRHQAPGAVAFGVWDMLFRGVYALDGSVTPLIPNVEDSDISDNGSSTSGSSSSDDSDSDDSASDDSSSDTSDDSSSNDSSSDDSSSDDSSSDA